MSPIIVIAASAGSLQPLSQIVSSLPSDCGACVLIVSHIGARATQLPKLLSAVSALPVSHAQQGGLVAPGHVILAPPDHHLRLKEGRMHLDRGPKIKHTRPAADPLFISAAETYGPRVVGIVLSGWDGDGAEGLRVVKQHGGVALVQHPVEAQVPEMPYAAIVADHPDACLPAAKIAECVADLCSGVSHCLHRSRSGCGSARC